MSETYYQKNKEYVRKRQKEYEQRNKVRIRKRKQEYRKNNREYLSERQKILRAMRKKEIHECYKRYRAKRTLLNGGGNPFPYTKSKKDRNLKDNYGISIEQYDEMVVWQDNRCAICGRHQSELKLTLCVDHDHETGKVRELICHQCNAGMGFLKDSIELLDKAKKYLEKHKE